MKELSTYGILKAFIKDVFPMVYSELSKWNSLAKLCPDNVLSGQATSSLSKKSFHALGGSVFALYPGVDTASMVKLIVSYQTISDYLDNLCDRAGVEDEEAFSHLHLAMVDALDLSSPINDYYKYYPHHDDGGYLKSLVNECRMRISNLPSYNKIKEYVHEYANLYSSLQVYKHLDKKVREDKLFCWAESYNSSFPYILPHEFCAATGSTLGIFMLFALASNPSIQDQYIIKAKEVYFPWICGLHILLDYFIDTNEDIENGDLNFVRYYKDSFEMSTRFGYFINSSLKYISCLEYSNFHNTVILGLLSMYLSDHKAYEPNIHGITSSILSSHGILLKLMHGYCRRLRKKGTI